jgi:hypothetical protein
MGDHGNEESPSWLPGSAPRSATLGSVQGAASAGAESSLAPPGSTFHLRAAERRRERSKKGTAGLCGTVAMEMHRRAPTTTLRTLFPGSQALPGSRVFPGSARLCIPPTCRRAAKRAFQEGHGWLVWDSGYGDAPPFPYNNPKDTFSWFPGSAPRSNSWLPGSAWEPHLPGSARLCVPHYSPQSGEEGVTMGDHGNEESLIPDP